MPPLPITDRHEHDPISRDQRSRWRRYSAHPGSSSCRCSAHVMLLLLSMLLIATPLAAAAAAAAAANVAAVPPSSHLSQSFSIGNVRGSRRRRFLDAKAGPHHSSSSPDTGAAGNDDIFSEPPDKVTPPSIFSLSRYVDPDSIVYDTIEGFFYAAIFTVILIIVYRCCCSCLDKCGVCPDDRYYRNKRRRRKGGGGHEYAAVSTDLYCGDHNRGGGGYHNEYGDYDGSSSGEESDVSLEYGEVDDERRRNWGDGTDRFDDRHIGDAAKRYFDREERIDKKKRMKNKSRNSGAESNGAGGRANGGGANKSRRGGLHRAISGGTGVMDEEEPAPLDLEMIERKIVESMEDGPEFAKPPKKEDNE